MTWRIALLLVLPPLLSVHGHVSLTFPPARSPALDFFTTSNSQPPCGVPKPALGQGIRTFFKSGTTVEIEWSSAVPHLGGIRLEVLNAVDQPIAIFTNFNDAYNLTETYKKVELPENFECANCAIRITHQATEYGLEYQFFSCADINILNEIPDGDTCLGNGQRVGGVCTCNQGFHGDSCEHFDECRHDDDCGVQGKCTPTGEQTRNQCFCPASRYGQKCEQESEVMRSLEEFDPSQYQKREDSGNEIYWRLLKDEIEFVLRFPGESWAALGWKSPDATCESDSNIVTTKHVASSPILQTSTIPALIVNATEREQNDAGDKECGPNEKWSECPESSRECEHSCDWTKFPETTPNCPNSCGKARCICKEGFVRMSNEDEVCVPFDFCNSAVEEDKCPSNSTWAKCGRACEPTCANMYDTAPCPATCEKPDCTCADNYVRHDGKCIYWGDCPEVGEKITNSIEETTVVVSTTTTNAPSTTTTTSAVVTDPTTVSQCAVNETLNECGRVCEADCVSIFTRSECSDCGAAGCSCIQGYARNPQGVCVYWGDCPTDRSEETPLSTTTPRMIPTTTSTTPKVTGDVCYGEFRSPAHCTECDYKLTWNFLEESDEIEFSLETRLPANSWTGVGFSTDGTMKDADMIIVKSDNGKLMVQDMTSTGYDVPLLDAVQNVKTENLIGTHANGVLRVQFTRKRNTGDSSDKQFDSSCWNMLFPVTGGRLVDGNVSIHSTRPLTSDKPVCIRSCKSTTPTTTKGCQNEYRYPAGCATADCEYIASWAYDTVAKDVRFEISSKTNGRWTGIGFSKDGKMANSDIYTGWMYDGKAYITDRFAYGRQLPAIDPADRQDIYDVGGKTEDDTQTIWFRRKLTSKDTTTDLPLDVCQYFLFPVGGGRVLARKSSDFTNPKTPIGYHDQFQPQVSAERICICDAAGTKVSRDMSVPVRVRVKRSTPSHPMYCTDMVIGMVADGRGRVRDFYSPSKATPKPDGFFGGNDDLTSASAFQADGVTTVVFRKKIHATEKWDNSFSKGPMTVIWAKGADPSQYVHTTGGNPIQADPLFFAPGSFKYHGRNQRGSLTIDFFEDVLPPKKTETIHGMSVDRSTCHGTFQFPDTCSGPTCQYRVTWESDGQVARFSLQSSIEKNHWSALGFSTDGNMAASDVVIVGLQYDDVSETNSITVTDQFMPSYGRPVIDEQQDIFDVETSYVDGILTANFSRELFSDDEKDVNLQECIYLLYTPAGGIIEKNGEIRKHGETPVASKHKICLNTCSEVATSGTKTSSSSTTPTAPTTTKAAPKGVKVIPVPPMKAKKPFTIYEPTEAIKSRYGIWVRILNKDYVTALANSETEYFQSFSKNVTRAMNTLLEKRWKGIQVSKVIGYEKGSVLAELELVSINDVPRPIELKSLIEENAIRGPIGGFSIEPSTVKAYSVESTTQVSVEDAMMDVPMWRNIGIITACSLAMLIFVVFFCCLLCRCRRRSTYSAYPVASAHLAYGARMLGEKKQMAGFDNAIYHNSRHYSQTTTASTKPPPSMNEACVDEPAPGVGETTYQEWYSKVGSKAQNHEESLPSAQTISRPPSTTPYVSYPNDPAAYYTLGGQHRTGKPQSTPQQQKYFPPY